MRLILAGAMIALVSFQVGSSQTPVALIGTIELPGVERRIDHLAVDTAAQRLYVAALGNNTVEVLDLKLQKNKNANIYSAPRDRARGRRNTRHTGQNETASATREMNSTVHPKDSRSYPPVPIHASGADQFKAEIDILPLFTGGEHNRRGVTRSRRAREVHRAISDVRIHGRSRRGASGSQRVIDDGVREHMVHAVREHGGRHHSEHGPPSGRVKQRLKRRFLRHL